MSKKGSGPPPLNQNELDALIYHGELSRNGSPYSWRGILYNEARRKAPERPPQQED